MVISVLFALALQTSPPPAPELAAVITCAMWRQDEARQPIGDAPAGDVMFYIPGGVRSANVAAIETLDPAQILEGQSPSLVDPSGYNGARPQFAISTGVPGNRLLLSVMQEPNQPSRYSALLGRIGAGGFDRPHAQGRCFFYEGEAGREFFEMVRSERSAQ